MWAASPGCKPLGPTAKSASGVPVLKALLPHPCVLQTLHPTPQLLRWQVEGDSSMVWCPNFAPAGCSVVPGQVGKFTTLEPLQAFLPTQPLIQRRSVPCGLHVVKRCTPSHAAIIAAHPCCLRRTLASGLHQFAATELHAGGAAAVPALRRPSRPHQQGRPPVYLQ